MGENESIVNKVDKLIESTYNTVKKVGANSDQIFSEISKKYAEIQSEQDNKLIPEYFKRRKIQEYLDLSQKFDDEIEKIFIDIDSKKAYFQSEAAEEK